MTFVFARPLARSALFLLTLCAASLLVACGDDDDSADAGDAGIDTAIDTRVEPESPRQRLFGVPETTRLTIPALERPAFVLRTEADVPHVYARNDHDLRVIQGYVTARDRYFQLEAGRRLGAGTLTELVGEGGLAADQLARGQGMAQIAERLASQLTREQIATLDAYVEGVNAYIQHVRDGIQQPPSEFQVIAPVLGMRAPALMEDLERQDLINFSVVAIFQLGFETGDPLFSQIADRLRTEFAGATDAALRRDGAIQDVFLPVAPTNPVSSAAGYGLEGGEAFADPPLGPTRPIARPELPSRLPVERSMMDRLLARNDDFEERLRGGRTNDFGSNAWATVGGAGENGHAILSGDGHLPLSIAPLFFQMGLDTSVLGRAGEEHTTVMGLFFAGIVPMAVGTNGKIAWSQTYLRGDVTDWYGEEIVLDDDGAPAASIFRGAEVPLERVRETYDVANIDSPLLPSVGRIETWDRYLTGDGRLIAAIEGREAEIDTVAGPGETVVNVQGDYVIPADIDGDGVISAVSFDFTAFDISNLLRVLEQFNNADNVFEFREASREFVTYTQNLVAADIEGNVYYGSYNAAPCRDYLPKNADGTEWVAGANPRALIDGTRYPSFEVTLDDDGMPIEGLSGERCIIPFDEWPSALNPDRGFVLTANNDIGNLSTDGSLSNDPFYIGGPWAPGYRAATIEEGLAEMVRDTSSTQVRNSNLQGDHTSVLGRQFAPTLLESIDEAQRIAELASPSADEQRILDLATAIGAERLEEVETRLRDWLARGAQAASGVTTFYTPASDTDRDDAVATMIFNEWWRHFVRGVFDDEGIDYAFSLDQRSVIPNTMTRLVEGRGASNPRDLASWNPATEESVFFDQLGTAEVESSQEIAFLALSTALTLLESQEIEPGIGGFGTDDMSEWLWGMRHMVQFDSIITAFAGDNPSFALLANGFAITPSRLPLAERLEEDDPRASLPWFPRPGDFYNVDAAHPSYSGPTYFYGNGPVMRMVVVLEEGNVHGVNILPGGQSGRTDSPHFSDQAALWLGNKTVPLRFELDDVISGASGRETFVPEGI